MSEETKKKFDNILAVVGVIVAICAWVLNSSGHLSGKLNVVMIGLFTLMCLVLVFENRRSVGRIIILVVVYFVFLLQFIR